MADMADTITTKTTSQDGLRSSIHAWQSLDGRFGLCVPERMITRMLRWCRRAGPRETGGILVGSYLPSLQWAIVTASLPAARDSRAGFGWFERGIQDMQARLDTFWRAHRPRYYLGEWHYHPGAAPQPSRTDETQMRQIAEDPGYHCPEPLLLLIGGNAATAGHLAAFVYPAHAPPNVAPQADPTPDSTGIPLHPVPLAVVGLRRPGDRIG